MFEVACIVEGHGEVEAVPILIRRIASEVSPAEYLEIHKPIRVKRNRFLNRETEFYRYVELAANKAGQHGAIIIILDADDDCPVDLASSIQRKLASSKYAEIIERIYVVIPNKEYEAWFIASAESLTGVKGFDPGAGDFSNSDLIRDCKTWMNVRKRDKKYREVSDQPTFTSAIDLYLAKQRSRSFRKMWDVVNSVVGLTDPKQV